LGKYETLVAGEAVRKMLLVNATATWHAEKSGGGHAAEYFMRKPICENWIAPRYITARRVLCESSKQIRSCSSWRKMCVCFWLRVVFLSIQLKNGGELYSRVNSAVALLKSFVRAACFLGSRDCSNKCEQRLHVANLWL